MMRTRIAGVILAVVIAVPAWAQSTNQLYMTGTGSGSTPTIFTNGIDTNISLALMPKGTGGVGIGSTNPASALDVNGTISTSGSSSITVAPPVGTTNVGWKMVLYGDGTSGNSQAMGIAINTTVQKIGTGDWFSIFGTTNPANDATITTPDTHAVVSLGANGNGLFSGKVGIGTTAPQVALDVNGGARIGNDAAACSATNAGELKYTSSQLYYCTGTCWRPSYITPASTTNLASYWMLDASSGTSAADSAGSNTGTLQGSPTWSPAGGQINGALSLASASTQYVQVPRASSLEPAAVSISVWIFPNGTQAADAGIVVKNYSGGNSTPNESYMLQVNTTASKVEFDIGYSGGRTALISSSTIPINTWTHLVGTYDPAVGLKLYVNGTLDNSAALVKTILYDTSSPSGDLYLGNSSSSSPNYFNGKLDDVRIYSSVLTATQVQNLYAVGGANCN